MPFQDQDS
jgi:hypothetical protein